MTEDDLAADLPAPRDDEPPTLRQEIFDELADHLACAMHREQLRTGDEKQARSNVLNQFGNPAAIARRLWWDAMKGKIMTTRLTAITSTIAAVATVAICLMLWRTIDQSNQLQAQLLESQQSMLSTMMETLNDWGESNAVADPEWHPLRVRLVYENGDPVHEARVYLTVENRTDLMGATDSEGLLEIGGVDFGRHQISILVVDESLACETEVMFRPDSDVFEILCPRFIDEAQPVVEIHPPDDLQNPLLAYLIRVNSRGTRQVGGRSWTKHLMGVFIFDSKGRFQGYRFEAPEETVDDLIRFPVGDGRIEVAAAVREDGSSQPSNLNTNWAGPLRLDEFNTITTFVSEPFEISADGATFVLSTDSPVWDKLRENPKTPSLTKFRFVKGEVDGPPASDLRVKVGWVETGGRDFGHDVIANSLATTGRELVDWSNGEGTAVATGNRFFALVAFTDWNESLIRQFKVAAGQQKSFVDDPIVVPTSAPETVELRFEIPSPEGMSLDEDVRYLIQLYREPRVVDGSTWYLPDPELALIVDREGTVLQSVKSSIEINDPHRVNANLTVETPPPFLAVPYTLESVQICRPAPIALPRSSRLGDMKLNPEAGPVLPKEGRVTFTPEAGQENAWTIELPKEAWEHLMRGPTRLQ